MLDTVGLQMYRERRFFEGWDGYVNDARICAAEACVQKLVDSLLSLGLTPSDAQVKAEVAQCVESFNQLDDGWIATIEREDIIERLSEIVELAGLDGAADWIDKNRDW